MLVVVVVASVVGFVVNALHGKGSRDVAAPTAPPPTAASATSSAPRFPDVIARSGDELVVVTAQDFHAFATLPFRATDVWVATVPAFSPGEWLVHVFGLAGGNAFRLEIGPAETLRDDLGPASAVLDARESPVLVHAGDPVTVSGPYGSGASSLPAGWQPAGFETSDYAGILVRAADSVGNVEIASWSPGGGPQVLATSGWLLGVTDGGQAIWLAPSCVSGPRCVLFFGDIGGLHPESGVQAPAGMRFVPGPVAYGSGGYLAVTAKRVAGPSAGESVLVLVDPWRGTARVIPGSDGVASTAGMFWADGHDLAFVTDDAAPGVRLAFFNAATNSTSRVGPRLPSGVRLLTAYGATSSVQPANSPPMGGVTLRP